MRKDSEGLEAEGNKWRTGIRRKGDPRVFRESWTQEI